MSSRLLQTLDYDHAEDPSILDKLEHQKLDILYPATQKKDMWTFSEELKQVASKGVEVRTHKRIKKEKGKDTHTKERKEKKSKKAYAVGDYERSRPQTNEKQEKHSQIFDLSGFEVIDLRRITEDSLIVKWNTPKSEDVQGYDIFVNGLLVSKVMSGTRRSAMIHSLDLSKSIQITLYAVTKYGRVEPPALAIYEVRNLT